MRILDLTKLARVSRPTFYGLYTDKEELLLAAYDEIAQRTAKTAIATPARAPYVAVQALEASGAVIGTSKTIKG